jgi:hypothetical protein
MIIAPCQSVSADETDEFPQKKVTHKLSVNTSRLSIENFQKFSKKANSSKIEKNMYLYLYCRIIDEDKTVFLMKYKKNREKEIIPKIFLSGKKR